MKVLVVLFGLFLLGCEKREPLTMESAKNNPTGTWAHYDKETDTTTTIVIHESVFNMNGNVVNNAEIPERPDAEVVGAYVELDKELGNSFVLVHVGSEKEVLPIKGVDSDGHTLLLGQDEETGRLTRLK